MLIERNTYVPLSPICSICNGERGFQSLFLQSKSIDLVTITLVMYWLTDYTADAKVEICIIYGHFEWFYCLFVIFIIMVIRIFNFSSQQGCCPCSYISPGAMRKSNLCSSLSLNVCVLN